MLFVGRYFCTSCKKEYDLAIGRIGQPSFQPKTIEEWEKYYATKMQQKIKKKENVNYYICGNCYLSDVRKKSGLSGDV